MHNDARQSRRITFARHAESLSNAENRFSTKPPGHPLSNLGEEQAHRLGVKLRGEGIGLVLHSPMLRARQTAEIAAEALSADVQVLQSDALLELDGGILEGRNGDEAMAELAGPWSSWTIDGDLDVRSAEGGETAREVLRRFDEAVSSIASGHALVVSHGGFLQLSIPNRAINLHNRHGYVNWLRNCQTVRTTLFDDGRLVCESWADRATHDLDAEHLIEMSA